jgi:hypothetical protein
LRKSFLGLFILVGKALALLQTTGISFFALPHFANVLMLLYRNVLFMVLPQIIAIKVLQDD